MPAAELDSISLLESGAPDAFVGKLQRLLILVNQRDLEPSPELSARHELFNLASRPRSEIGDFDGRAGIVGRRDGNFVNMSEEEVFSISNSRGESFLATELMHYAIEGRCT